MSKKDVLNQLRAHLADVFDRRFMGTDGIRHAEAKGFADGYMQALADLALVEDRELLALVNDERYHAGRRADIGLASIPPGPPVADFA